MTRFTMNRWWALLLTLCLFTACFFLLSTAPLTPPARADGSGSQLLPSDPAPGSGFGDPDVPIGPGGGKPVKQCVTRGGSSPLVTQTGAATVGDGRGTVSVLVMRLRLFLLSLRSFYLRF